MKIDEHKAILSELNSDSIEASRKMELIAKLSDDYTVTQAEITTASSQIADITKDRDHFADLSKKLWLENSATLTDIKDNKDKQTTDKIEHQAKRTFDSLASKF